MTQPQIFVLKRLGNLRLLFSAASLLLGCLVAGCSTTDQPWQGTSSPTGGLIIPSNFDQALKENQKALAENKGQPDVALYSIGVILAHSANPKKDYFKALNSFKTLVKDYPASPRAEPAKIWIQAIELNYKNLEEGQKLTEEKRAVARERDTLARDRDQLVQERNKLNYAIEKSRQLDTEIEKRRKQSLNR
jgi:hypothetical protein